MTLEVPAVKKLIETNLDDFLDQLSSECPTPGGGSVAALEGAFGAALVEMAARLTIGREKFANQEALMQQALEKAYRLRCQMSELVDMDTDAYNNVTEAYKLPKATEEQKATRASAIQDALKMATNIPAETMEAAKACLKIVDEIKDLINPNCASDLAVAKLSLNAALEGAWMNVSANLPSIRDDQYADMIRSRCQLNK